MYGIIYVVVNIINGKVYVGQTTVSLDKRKANHHCRAKKGSYDSHFHRALRRYGKNAFEWRVLQEAIDEEHLNALEIYWIRTFDTISNGYNTKEGGSNGKHTEKTKQKIREIMRGNIPWNKNKGHTEEACRKMSESHKGKYMGADHPNAKAIMCVETGKAYGAISEAARETDINCRCIGLVINGKRRTAGDYHWKFI